MAYQWLYKIKYSDRNNYEKVYNERYNSPSTYRYDFNVASYPAFVVVNTELLRLIYEIQALDKTLHTTQNKLPTVALESYKRKCLIDEIRQTNELEGVASTRKEINDILEQRAHTNTRLQGIVNKYAMLINESSIPLSNCNDIRELYNDLVLEEVKQNNPENVPDGNIFRKDPVYVKDKNTQDVIHTGLYPETKIIESMTALLSSIENSSYNALINIAVVHYMFGYIHPFYDGNGRLSRFISSYLLSKNLEQIIGYRLAYAIKKDTNKYYKMFKLTNDEINRGDLTCFTMYFMELIRDVLTDLNSKLTDYIAQLKEYEKIINKLDCDKFGKNLLYILTQSTLFTRDGLSIQTLCDILKKSDTTIRKSIKLLKEKELILKLKTRPYKYVAKI